MNDPDVAILVEILKKHTRTIPHYFLFCQTQNTLASSSSSSFFCLCYRFLSFQVLLLATVNQRSIPTGRLNSNSMMKGSSSSTSTTAYAMMMATALVVLLQQATLVSSQEADLCFGNDELNDIFAEFRQEPTCCQNDICGIPCPEPVSKPTKGKSLNIPPCQKRKRDLF